VSWDKRATSFLTSWTGILTAITALAAAIAGIVTAVSKFGGGESAPPARTPAREVATAPAPATTVIVESDAQRELRSHIPDRIWLTCGTPRYPEEGSVAAFNCKYREVVGLQYNLFASSQELEKGYKAVKQRYGLAASPSGTSCGTGNFEGVYRVGGGDVGRYLCFIDKQGHVASIVWTDRRFDIMSFAWRDDLLLAPLFESWQKGVGPTE
jgi:hypothetical protein